MASTEISVSTRLEDHLHGVVEKRLSRLSQCRTYWTTEDPVEAVHDLRVASRRLRAFVDVFRPVMDESSHDRARKPLRKVTRAMGALRDWDVQLGLLAERRAGADGDLTRAALEHLSVSAAKERAHVEKEARRKLERIDLDSMEARVRAAARDAISRLPSPGVETNLFALSLLVPFVAKVHQDSTPKAGDPDMECLHQLRIDLKKLRYAIELFEPVLGDGYRKLHGEVENLQELLGAHHDLTVLAALAVNERAALLVLGHEALASGLLDVALGLQREETAALERFRAAAFDAEAYRGRLEAALLGGGGGGA